jgi:hypothetical protein
MAHTYPWLTVNAARERLGLTTVEVLVLIHTGALVSRPTNFGGHEVERDSVEAYIARQDRPTVRGGDPIGDEAEHGYDREQADFTPIDEGDEQQ